MGRLKHLVVGPFDVAQAIREIAAALEDLEAEVETLARPDPEPDKVARSTKKARQPASGGENE